MKPYTWKKIAEASKAEKKLIVETYGLLGAVAIELSHAMTGALLVDSMACAVHKHLRLCGLCVFETQSCDYEGARKNNWIKWYAELHKASRKKK